MKTFQDTPEQLYKLVSEEQGIGGEIMVPEIGTEFLIKTQHIKLDGLEMAIGLKKDYFITTFILYKIIPPIIIGKERAGLLAILYIEGGKLTEDGQSYFNELQHFYSFGSSASFDPSLVISYLNNKLSLINREGQPEKIKIAISEIKPLLPFKK